jgi:hypothetical protein
MRALRPIRPHRGRNDSEQISGFAAAILLVMPARIALIRAAPALTMIKESLTSGFLWSAKPIGCPSGKGRHFAALSALPCGHPGEVQADAPPT